MPKTRAVPRTVPVVPAPARVSKPFRLEDSRAVSSSFVWRAFAMMSLVALGFCINFAVQGYTLFYTACWGVIAVFWLAFSMFLWRQHTRWTNGEIGTDPS
jgi:hypothetical protein